MKKLFPIALMVGAVSIAASQTAIAGHHYRRSYGWYSCTPVGSWQGAWQAGTVQPAPIAQYPRGQYGSPQGIASQNAIPPAPQAARVDQTYRSFSAEPGAAPAAVPVAPAYTGGPTAGYAPGMAGGNGAGNLNATQNDPSGFSGSTAIGGGYSGGYGDTDTANLHDTAGGYSAGGYGYGGGGFSTLRGGTANTH